MGYTTWSLHEHLRSLILSLEQYLPFFTFSKTSTTNIDRNSETYVSHDWMFLSMHWVEHLILEEKLGASHYVHTRKACSYHVYKHKFSTEFWIKMHRIQNVANFDNFPGDSLHLILASNQLQTANNEGNIILYTVEQIFSRMLRHYSLSL